MANCTKHRPWKKGLQSKRLIYCCPTTLAGKPGKIWKPIWADFFCHVDGRNPAPVDGWSGWCLSHFIGFQHVSTIRLDSSWWRKISSIRRQLLSSIHSTAGKWFLARNNWNASSNLRRCSCALEVLHDCEVWLIFLYLFGSKVLEWLQERFGRTRLESQHHQLQHCRVPQVSLGMSWDTKPIVQRSPQKRYWTGWTPGNHLEIDLGNSPYPGSCAAAVCGGTELHGWFLGICSDVSWPRVESGVKWSIRPNWAISELRRVLTLRGTCFWMGTLWKWKKLWKITMLFMAKSTMSMAMESSSQTASHDRRGRMRNEKQVASPQHFTSKFHS